MGFDSLSSSSSSRRLLELRHTSHTTSGDDVGEAIVMHSIGEETSMISGITTSSQVIVEGFGDAGCGSSGGVDSDGGVDGVPGKSSVGAGGGGVGGGGEGDGDSGLTGEAGGAGRRTVTLAKLARSSLSTTSINGSIVSIESKTLQKYCIVPEMRHGPEKPCKLVKFLGKLRGKECEMAKMVRRL